MSETSGNLDDVATLIVAASAVEDNLDAKAFYLARARVILTEHTERMRSLDLTLTNFEKALFPPRQVTP